VSLPEYDGIRENLQVNFNWENELMKKKFTAEALTRILDQSVCYQCACPAQVCEHINRQRALYDYQSNCLNLTDTDRAVHECIAETIKTAHAAMEDCLVDILRLEGWDMATLEMPESLKTRILRQM
jgi:hypothetical protein